jgi:hypothetical protein
MLSVLADTTMTGGDVAATGEMSVFDSKLE